MTQNPFDALGGGFDMNALLQQAQQMQQQLEEAQAALAQQTVDGTVAGGAVTVTANGVGSRCAANPRSSGVTSSPAATRRARWSRFCSSRTFPGQACASRARSAAAPRVGDRPGADVRASRCRAIGRMSSGRARSAGTAISITFSLK